MSGMPLPPALKSWLRDEVLQRIQDPTAVDRAYAIAKGNARSRALLEAASGVRKVTRRIVCDNQRAPHEEAQPAGEVQRAVAQVRGRPSSLADAFDRAKAQYDSGVSGRPLAMIATTHKSATPGSTFAD